MDYSCNICNKKYSSYQSLWIHNKKFHKVQTPQNNIPDIKTPQNITLTMPTQTQQLQPIKNQCEYCKKILSRYDSLKRHKEKCSEKHSQTLNEREKLKEEIKQELKKELEISKPTTKIINNISGNLINGNNTDNGPKMIIYKSGLEDMNQLGYNEVSTIFDNEISSVIKLIELVNFNKKMPQNHSFCSTALESPYLSFYNTDTNTVDKERKKYFFEDMICKSIQNHEILYGKYKNKFGKEKREKIEDNIANLKRLRDSGYKNEIIQEMIRKLNLLSYNKRELIQKTWNGDVNDVDSDEEFMKIILKDSDNESDSSISSESESDTDCNKLKPSKVIKKKQLEFDI
jgi:hypothetical protein